MTMYGYTELAIQLMRSDRLLCEGSFPGGRTYRCVKYSVAINPSVVLL